MKNILSRVPLEVAIVLLVVSWTYPTFVVYSHNTDVLNGVAGSPQYMEPRGTGLTITSSTDTHFFHLATSTINGVVLNGATLTFSTGTDANVRLAINSAGSSWTFVPSWVGVLDESRGGTGTSTYLKGDLLVAKDANTLVRVGVGSDGQVLVASSSAEAGVAWEFPRGLVKLENTILINDPNLLAYYKLEDTSDSSGNNKTLTNNNSTAFASGKFDDAANFGSGNSNKSLTRDDALGINGGVISIVGWINPTDIPASGAYHGYISQHNTSAEVTYTIWYRDNGGTPTLAFARTRRGIVDQEAAYAVTLATGTWYHIAGTYDGTNLRLYLNGVLQGGPTAASGNGNDGSPDQISIGKWAQASANYASGRVDDAAIFNRALTASEISGLANGF